MPRSNQHTILAAKAATGIGSVMDVSSYDYVVVSVGTASSANLTVKFVGTVMDTVPDFTAAKSVTNMFDYLNFVDMQAISTNLPAMIAGSTGLAPAGTDDFRLFRVDVRGLKWFNAVVTARAAGSITAYVRGGSVGSL